MKHLISTSLEHDWEYLSLSLRGSHAWDEFGFGATVSCSWYRNTVSNTGHRRTANILTIHFLWWYFQVSLWI